MRSPREDIPATFGSWANRLAVFAVGFLPFVYVLVALFLAIGKPSDADDARALALGKFTVVLGGVLSAAALVSACLPGPGASPSTRCGCRSRCCRCSGCLPR
jgi:hypothetical protein